MDERRTGAAADGVLDRIEWDWNRDTDLDGKINALDKDSDNDGVPDGTEDARNEESEFDLDRWGLWSCFEFYREPALELLLN